MQIKEMLQNKEIGYRAFYEVLRDKELGDWDSINNTETIQSYIVEKMKEGIPVSHILQAIEIEHSEHDDWWIWLGNSRETPSPINTKEDLVEALRLDEEDLLVEI